MTHTPIRTYLYLRLSDGRNENGTFAEREARLRERAASNGWQVVDVVIENDVLPDGRVKNASAYKRRKIGTDENGQPIMRVWRPGFRSILDGINQGQAEALVTEALDRSMRDPRDLEDLIDAIESRKAWADSLAGTLRFTAGGTDAERTTARVQVALANQSSRDTARRVAWGRERQAGRGIWGGGRRPYGYRPVSDPSGNHRNTRLTLDEDEANALRRAAEQVLEGVSMKAIAREMGTPTVTGTKWSAQTLRDVLMKPLTAGIITYQGEPTQQRLPEAVLPVDVWQAVCRRLTDPEATVSYVDRSGQTREVKRGINVGRAPTWLGTGIYRCVCGAGMRIQCGTKRQPTYKCSGGEGDVHVRINAAQADAWVRDILLERFVQPDAASLFKSPTPKVDVAAVRAEIKRLEEEMIQDKRDKDAGDITRAQFLDSNRRNMARLAEMNAALASVSNVDPAVKLATGDVASKWADMTLGEQRKLLSMLLSITIKPASRMGAGFDSSRVDVQWRKRK